MGLADRDYMKEPRQNTFAKASHKPNQTYLPLNRGKHDPIDVPEIKNSKLTLFLMVFSGFLFVTLAYVIFTIFCMVPNAQHHFLDLLMNPQIEFFNLSGL